MDSMNMRLKFDKDLCLKCDSYACLTKCIYLNYDFDRAKEERQKIALGEYSRVLEECQTCYGCEEYCPYGNHPFYQLAELQEYYGVKKLEESVVRELVERYRAKGEFTPKKVGGKFVHICLFPEIKNTIKGKLFEGYDVLRGRHVFCNMIYLHYGMISVLKERAPKIIENIHSLRVHELVLYHDECYAFYNSFARAYGIEVPFNYIHLFEHLYKMLREMEVKELGIKVAYQRNCSNRLIPETDKILDEIFDIIGVERVEREFDRDKALCCGAQFVLSGQKEKAYELQKKNVDDIVKSGATHVVFNCPMCFTVMAEKVRAEGLEPIMVSELCKMAIGEY